MPRALRLYAPAPRATDLACVLSRFEDEVGPEPEQQPEKQHPGDEHREPELPVDVHDLLHDVEDRTSRDGKKRDRHSFVDPSAAHDRPQEGGAAADEAEEPEKGPA